MAEKDKESWLDAALVLGALGIVAFVVIALMFAEVPENQLAVVSSIVSALVGGVIGAYSGFRWATSKQASETIRDMARQTAPPPPPPPSPETLDVTAETVNVQERPAL